MSDTVARADLRALTAARVSLPMTGHSVAMEEVLGFELAHARARDAVHAGFDGEGFARRVRAEVGMEAVALRSRAKGRAEYLRHPQLGRLLDDASASRLARSGCDVAITVADGLSALAVERNAIALLAVLVPRLRDCDWSVGPVAVVEQGRVAVGDAVGEGMGARCGLVLIGERPGLSAADSMGAYLTWAPRVGRTDAERNCLSNIRGGGLGVVEAAERLVGLMVAARELGATGVGLKEGVRGLG
ncbi:MAG: ethanolamine ammonia-lyase subunit EutC [Acidobacteriaceae bacterium]